MKFFEIIKSGTQIDFIGRWRTAVAVSLSVIAAGAIGALVLGVKFGVDFAGGTEVHVRFDPGVAADEGKIRKVMGQLALPGPSVIRYGEDSDFLVRFQGERKIEKPGADPNAPLSAENDRVLQLDEALGRSIGGHAVERVEFVGPKVGAQLRNNGLKALGISFLLILGYVWFRFSAAFAPGAVIALVHDVLVTASLWILMGREFDLSVLAAGLALVGYSLNDTIIVYDRIRETMQLHGRGDLAAVINESVNHTLSRTLITSGVTMLSVLMLLALGGPVVRSFSLAMTIGIVVGTYSSIYIAAPIALALEERKKARAARPPVHPVRRPEKKARG